MASDEPAAETTTPRPARGAGRQALIDATIRVASRDGMQGVTLRAVAREAGVTNGLIVHHFGTRAALMREALGSVVSDSIDVSHLHPPAGAPCAVAAQLGERVEAAAADELFAFQVLIEAVRSGELLDDQRAAYERFMAETAQALGAAGVEPSPALARLVFAALDGLVVQQLVFGDRAQTEEALAELHRIIGGLASR